MSAKLQEQQGQEQKDIFKWLLILALLGAGVWANYQYSEITFVVRLTGWILLGCVLVVIAAFTRKGRLTIAFLRDAKIELRKVVWPTRQETLHTTLLVLGMVIVVALVIWGMDAVLLWAVGVLTGQRG